MNSEEHHPKIKHADGKILECNEEFKRLVPAVNKEIVGENLTKLLNEKTIQDLKDSLTQDRNICTIRTQLETTSKPGEPEKNDFLIVTSSADSNSYTTKFINFDYIKSLDSLSENTKKNTPIGITVGEAGSEDNPLIYANEGFADITGYTQEEVIGRDCRFLQGEKTSDETVREMAESIKKAEPVSVEIRNYKKSGEMFWNKVTIVPVTDENNEVEYFIGYQEDITEKKRQDIQRQIFQQQANNSRNMIAILDGNLDIFYVNEYLCEKTRYEENELLGTPVKSLYSSESQDKFEIMIQDSETQQTIIESKNGEFIHIEQNVNEVSGADIITENYYIINMRELTEEMINNQVIDVLNRVLRHNLRTDVTVIQGHADMMESEDNSNKKEIESIQNRTRNMEEIADKMSRVRNIIKSTSETKPVTIEELEQDISNYASLYNLNVEFSGDYEGSSSITPGGIVDIISEDIMRMMGDEDREVQSVINIQDLGNKFKVSFSSDDDFVDTNDWEIVCSGEENPLKHTIGIDLWVIRWSIISVGGSVELKQQSNGQSFELTVPKAR